MYGVFFNLLLDKSGVITYIFLFFKIFINCVFITGKSKKNSVSSNNQESEVLSPIFGLPLEEAVERTCYHDKILLPGIVRECIEDIETRGFSREGIYRVSGVKSVVEELIKKYNR